MMGLSDKHHGSAPLVLNPTTGTITTKFHVVFDDWFATIGTSPDELPAFESSPWVDLFGTTEFHSNDDDATNADDSNGLYDDEPSTLTQCQMTRVAETYDLLQPPTPLDVAPPPSFIESPARDDALPTPIPSPSPYSAPLPQASHQREMNQSTPNSPKMPTMDQFSSIGAPQSALPDNITVPTANMKLTSANKSSQTSIQTISPLKPSGPTRLFDGSKGSTSDTDHCPSPSMNSRNGENGSIQIPRVIDKIRPGPTWNPGSISKIQTISSTNGPSNKPTNKQPHPLPPSASRPVTRSQTKTATIQCPTMRQLQLTPALRRSTRSTFGIHKRDPDMHYPGAALLVSLFQDDMEAQIEMRELWTYKASNTDPDMLSYDEAMRDVDRDKWIKSATKEIRELEQHGAWDKVPASDAKKKITPTSWVFCGKRAPDGTLLKWKGRFVVRGDLEPLKENESNFSPVTSWTSIRVLLTLSLIWNWTSCTMDFANAFIQSKLESPKWIHLPCGFQSKLPGKVCLRLNRSVNGGRNCPCLFYELVMKALKEFGFKESKMDPCFLFKKGMMAALFVDDVLLKNSERFASQNLTFFKI
jgi:Reverse transcriptase (RNA-dependent DNA polymerase)